MEKSDIENDDNDLDPRIQIELEQLNTATDEINKLEIELDEATTTFRMLLNESTRRLKLFGKKLGSCIEKARPYYKALDDARNAQLECQKAAVQYQRANGRPTTLDNDILRAEVEANPCQTLEELSNTFNPLDTEYLLNVIR